MKTLISIVFLLKLFAVEIDSQTNSSISDRIKIEVAPISQIDAVGTFVLLLENVLNQRVLFRTPHNNSVCDSWVWFLDKYELVMSNQPKGDCPYCCPLEKPIKDYLSFYYARKGLGDNFTKIELTHEAGTLKKVNFKSDLPTVIYIHGFSERGNGPSGRWMRDSFLNSSADYNILCLDWGELCTFPWYGQAVAHAKLIPKIVANFIKFYVKTGELSTSKLHIVGFSLGAHVAGVIGKYFQGPHKIPRITGLDPSLPLFANATVNEIITRNDAEFVDIIHTDGGKMGMGMSMGHTDFYPNGGTFLQPGCKPSNLVEYQILYQTGTCGHNLAWRLFGESVANPKAFPATKCGIMKNGTFKKCDFVLDAYMGFMADKNSTAGDYFLTTNGESPFGRSVEEQLSDVKIVNLIL